MRTGTKDRVAYYFTLCKHSLSIQCEILFVLQSGIKSSLDLRCHSRPFIIPGRPVRHIQLYHDNILSLYRRKYHDQSKDVLQDEIRALVVNKSGVLILRWQKVSPPTQGGSAVSPPIRRFRNE